MTYRNQILAGDNSVLLPLIPDESIDVVFADPPFNLGKRYSTTTDALPDDIYLYWSHRWLLECVRVLKPSGSIFVHNIPRWLVKFGGILDDVATFKHWIAWDSRSVPRGKTMQPHHYGILFYTKSAKGFTFNQVRAPHALCRHCNGFLKDWGGKSHTRHPWGALVSDVWSDIHRASSKSKLDEHPCHLPIHLLERIILLSSNPGDIILDPFMGMGTTAIAAKRLGRDYIGIDESPDYVDISRKKVALQKPVLYEGRFVSRYAGKILSITDADTVGLAPPITHRNQTRLFV